MNRLACLAAAIALLFAATGWTADLRPFNARSMEVIRAAHAGKPFVLALWSITCEPCRDEMAHWKHFRQKFPRVPVVLVATDLPGERAAVRNFLSRYNPGPVETWAFADDFSERVRYSVDRAWRGELPRTYFFDAAHVAEAHSGALDLPRTEAWFARQSRNRARTPQ